MLGCPIPGIFHKKEKAQVLRWYTNYQNTEYSVQKITWCFNTQTQSYICKLLDRAYGAVWTTTSPPSGPLSVRMLFSDENGDETWVVPVNDIPKNWKAGDIYDSGVQVIA